MTDPAEFIPSKHIKCWYICLLIVKSFFFFFFSVRKQNDISETFCHLDGDGFTVLKLVLGFLKNKCKL